MKWIEYKIEVKPGFEELVENILYSMDLGTFSVEEPNLLDSIKKNPGEWDYIDEDYLRERERELGLVNTRYNIYFSQEDRPEEKLDQLISRLESSQEISQDKYKIEVREVEDKDWSENWKKFYKPLEVGRNFVIKPSWEDYDNKDERLIIELDPGMAFGTGTHESTYMCIELLEDYMEEDFKVFDIGTGSGILAMAARELKAKEVIAIDMDPMAVRVARENIADNSMDDIVSVRQGDLLSSLDSKADLIVANILAEIIISMTGDIAPYLKKGGIFISSGIILEKLDLVEAELLRHGFEILEIKKKNSWAAIAARMG